MSQSPVNLTQNHFAGQPARKKFVSAQDLKYLYGKRRQTVVAMSKANLVAQHEGISSFCRDDSDTGTQAARNVDRLISENSLPNAAKIVSADLSNMQLAAVQNPAQVSQPV